MKYKTGSSSILFSLIGLILVISNIIVLYCVTIGKIELSYFEGITLFFLFSVGGVINILILPLNIELNENGIIIFLLFGLKMRFRWNEIISLKISDNIFPGRFVIKTKKWLFIFDQKTMPRFKSFKEELEYIKTMNNIDVMI